MLDRQLSHVLAVADTGSFTKAAERVGLTQPGVTRSIADLERSLGYALFYRTARGILLTEQGRDFAERANQLLQDAQSLLSNGREQDDPFARTLRIGVCPSSLEWRLAEPLSELLSRHPSMRFQVIGSSIERLVQQVRSGGVDVAIGLEEAFVEWTDIKREPIGEVRGVLFVRKGHPLTHKESVTPSELTAYDCVLPTDARPIGSILRDLFEAKGEPWQRHLHVTDNLAIAMRLVATSDAFALTSEDVADSANFIKLIEKITGDPCLTTFQLCCATRSRWELAAPVKAFVRRMREVLPPLYEQGA